MDPISQAVVGATLTQSVTKKKKSQILTCFIGALAGMDADIDVIFQSQTDPLMFLEFHRQFTHSLLFIPVGGLERFRWFSDGYIVLSPIDNSLIGDIRYSMLPNSIEPLWGIRPNPKQPEQHVEYVVMRKFTPEKRHILLAMLFD